MRDNPRIRNCFSGRTEESQDGTGTRIIWLILMLRAQTGIKLIVEGAGSNRQAISNWFGHDRKCLYFWASQGDAEYLAVCWNIKYWRIWMAIIFIQMILCRVLCQLWCTYVWFLWTWEHPGRLKFCVSYLNKCNSYPHCLNIFLSVYHQNS